MCPSVDGRSGRAEINRFPEVNRLSSENSKIKNMTKEELLKKGLENQLVFFSYEGRELRGMISNTVPKKDKMLETQWFYVPRHLWHTWTGSNAEQKKALTDVEMIDIDKIMWCVALR